MIALIVSARLATLYELSTVYSAKDAYDLAEIVIVDSHNRVEAQNEANRKVAQR